MRTRLAVLAALLAVSCVSVPPDREPPEMSRQELRIEDEIAAQAEEQIAEEIRLYPDGAVQSYVRGVGMNVARASDRPDLVWSFEVVDDPQLNAFTIGDGKVYVYSGLLRSLENEAQLASVLAHEVAHVARFHTVVTAERASQTQLLVGLAGAVIGDGELVKLAQGVAASILQSGFSRDLEDQADRVGLDFTFGAGYDVREFPEVFRILAAQAGGTGGSPFGDLFRSHSSASERIRATTNLVEEDYAGRFDGLRVGRDAYRQMKSRLR